MRSYLAILILLVCYSCKENKHQIIEDEGAILMENEPHIYPTDKPYIIVLGIAQDAGFPQASCKKSCCKLVWKNFNSRKMVSCLALVDPVSQKSWMFDATPDFKEQQYYLEQTLQTSLEGIFLTHAHMGHYTGLMHLGREAIGAKEVPVFAMPRLRKYLAENGPWSQLVDLNNISLQSMEHDSTIRLSESISVTPYLVPHRGEFSETVGYYIKVQDKQALFIPDIDKWHLWDRDIAEEVQKVNYAFLDGTFYKNGEIPGRDMSKIPHPFIEESLETFKDLSDEQKSKVYFIHFNHTNPILQAESLAQQEVKEIGLNIAEEFAVYLMH